MLKIELVSVDSTSRYLKNFFSSYGGFSPVLCRAMQQVAGYGQYGRQWDSASDSLTFSLAVPLCEFQPGGWMSLVVAFELHASLMQMQTDNLKIKWPNDIYNGQGKVSGCLIEVMNNSNGNRFLNIGIGINLASIENPREYQASYISVSSVNDFLDSLCQRLSNPQLFSKINFQTFLRNFKMVDYFSIGQSVIVYDCDSAWPGKYLGLSSDGFPLIEINGAQKLFNSGRTSIRPA